jgi:hypothetical protein
MHELQVEGESRWRFRIRFDDPIVCDARSDRDVGRLLRAFAGVTTEPPSAPRSGRRYRITLGNPIVTAKTICGGLSCLLASLYDKKGR